MRTIHLRRFQWVNLGILCGGCVGLWLLLPPAGKDGGVNPEEARKDMDEGTSPKPFLNGPTDTDGDGIPDQWESDHGLDPGFAGDGASDFDRDGLGALDEYNLWQASGGTAGNPLGTWNLEIVAPPPELSNVTSIYPVAVAANGLALVRVQGALPSESSKGHFYVLGTDEPWIRITAPGGYPGTVTSIIMHDINRWGDAVGVVNGSAGTRGFFWEAETWTAGGEASLFLLDGVAAVPLRVSDTGFVAGYVPSQGNRRFAAFEDGEIDLDGGWANLSYMDVNSFGEFTGTWSNPLTGQIETFLASEYLQEPFTTVLGFEEFDRSEFSNVVAPQLVENLVQYSDPDEYGVVFGWGPEVGTGNTIVFMINQWGDRYWEYYDWQEPGFYELKYAAELFFYSSLATLNDWGELAGVCDADQWFMDPYGVEYGVWLNTPFVFDGEYRIAANDVPSMANSFPVSGLTNDGCVAGGNRIWIDNVIAAASDLHPGAGTPSLLYPVGSGEFHMGVYSGSAYQYRILRRADDFDADGMPDDWELKYGLDPADPEDAAGDNDGDGLNNLAEFRFRTDPLQTTIVDPATGVAIDLRPGIDTDGDGIPDTWEWHYGLDYTNPGDALLDFDRDGVANLHEFLGGTDPWRIDSDGDGLSDMEDGDAREAMAMSIPGLNGFQIISPLE